MRRAGALLALSALVLGGCASHARGVATAGLEVVPEPAFSGVSTTEVGAAMEAALEQRLKRAPAIAARHFASEPAARTATFEPLFATLIRSDTGLLQRIELEAVVPSIPQDMHGPCTQRVALWFMPEGELVGAYVRRPICPI